MNRTLHLMARMAGRAVAFPAARVDSVVDLEAIVAVPLAPPGVVGLAALRSRVVTVIDPRLVLEPDIEPCATRRAVVTCIDGHSYAILVEQLDDVADHAMLPLPPGIAPGGKWGAAAAGLIDRAGEPVLVLALESLIPREAALAA